MKVNKNWEIEQPRSSKVSVLESGEKFISFFPGFRFFSPLVEFHFFRRGLSRCRKSRLSLHSIYNFPPCPCFERYKQFIESPCRFGKCFEESGIFVCISYYSLCLSVLLTFFSSSLLSKTVSHLDRKLQDVKNER
jgi:hypothetical protein